MQNTPTISNNKIIFLVVFICAALITSLFVFRMNHKTPGAAFNTDNALIFPEARELKPFELKSADNQPFSEKNLRDHWTLIFFGFTHCASVCPTTLEMLKSAYPELHKQYPNLQVLLVSLDPERDTPSDVSKYAQAFNADFLGATGKMEVLRKLQGTFGIYSAKESNVASNYQLQHTSSIILVNPRGQWSGLFKFGMKPEEFVKTFGESMKFIGA